MMSGIFSNDEIVLCGYQKKLKTMKKKYFVLYKKTNNASARLEYYDNERKFKSRVAPKRVIELKNCFNINRRLDPKHEYVIALSTKDDGFGIVFENEHEMNRWLENLKELQRYESDASDQPLPYFDHVWQVKVQKKGLAEEKGIFGAYHLCLSPKSVTLLRIGPEKAPNGDTRKTNIEFLLTTIRRCGDSSCYFYMEVGRQSVLGPGDLYMDAEDPSTAQSMHEKILKAMSARKEKTAAESEPMRKRSSSANEASKPIIVLQRRQTHPESKVTDSTQTLQTYVRERCDSLPSRNRTSSECSNQSVPSSFHNFRNALATSRNPHQFHRHSNSPPMNSNMGCSESEESSLSVDEPDDNGTFTTYRFNSRSSEGVIPEENTDEITSFESKSDSVNSKFEDMKTSYVTMAPVKISPHFYKQKTALNDAKAVQSSATSLNRASQTSAFEFREFTSDKFLGSSGYEAETQTERPTRTYSIGSKIEHDRMHHKICNNIENEHNMRVRALSVGSKAKIPRCDLQRDILFRNIEHNSNSNNNINFQNEVASYNQNIKNIAAREKKSTSAPLLLNKSQNSVDTMGDLMEIDFSKKMHYPHNQKYSSKPTLKVPMMVSSTSTLMQDPSSRRDDMKQQYHHHHLPQFSQPAAYHYHLDQQQPQHHHPPHYIHQQQQQQHHNQMLDENNSLNILNTATTTILTSTTPTAFTTTMSSSAMEDIVSQTDNGYLEMKPVGNTLSYMTKMNVFNEPTTTLKYCPSNTKRTKTDSTSSNLSSSIEFNDNQLEKNRNIINEITTIKTLAPTTKTINPIISSILEEKDKDVNNGTSQINNIDMLSENVHEFNLKGSPTTTPVAELVEAKQKINNNTEYINIDGTKTFTPDTISTNETNSSITNHKDSKKYPIENFKNRIIDGSNNKLPHSVSEDNCGKNSNSNILQQDNKSGYEILQIKSDSSLEANKFLNRNNTSLLKNKTLHSLLFTQNLKVSTSLATTTTSSASTSSSSSPTSASGSSIATTTTAMPSTKIPSSCSVDRPAPITEHKLYYASLDLPQSTIEPTCQSQLDSKINQSSPINTLTQNNTLPVININNSYVKIDFEQSDSSATSIYKI